MTVSQRNSHEVTAVTARKAKHRKTEARARAGETPPESRFLDRRSIGKQCLTRPPTGALPISLKR